LDAQIKWAPFPSHLRALWGATIFLTLVFCGVVGCTLWQLPLLIFVRPFSRRLWRKANSFYNYTWFLNYLFFSEWISGVRVKISGLENIPKGERVLVMSNHPSEADWLYFWSVSYHLGNLPYHRIILKDLMRYVPGLGWAIDNFDFFYLTRKWQRDEQQLRFYLDSMVEDNFPVNLLIFPEGTDLTPAKRAKANAYAATKGLPQFNHLIVPRTTGFTTCLSHLRPSLQAVYDYTVAYEGGVTPTLLSGFCGSFPRTVHIQIRRFDIGDIPTQQAEMESWLMDRYKEKDELLHQFSKTQSFKEESLLARANGFEAAFWCLFWTTMTLATGWATWNVTWMWWFQAVGWVIWVTLSASHRARVLIGRDIPFKTKP